LTVKIGIGISPWTYYQTDDKVNNLLHPLASYYPTHRGTSTYDADGWPLTIDTGTSDDSNFMVAMDRYIRPGRYRIDAIGSGQVAWWNADLPGGAVRIDFHAPAPGARTVGGEYDLHTPGALFGVASTSATDHLRDVRIYRTTNDPTQTFTPEYLAEIGKFAAFRFPGWGDANMADCAVDWPANPALPTGEPARLRAHIELCNLTGRDAWYACPFNASDAHIAAVARTFAALLHPGLKVYLEYANEVWNWLYPSTTWINNYTHNQLGHPEWSEQGGHAVLAGNFHKVFAQNAPDVRIVRTIGSQFFFLEKYRQVMDIAGRYGITFDAVHTAPYTDPFQGGYDEAGTVSLLQSDYAGNLEACTRRLFDCYDASLSYMTPYADAFKAEAAKYGHRMIAYECGPGFSLDHTNPQPELDFLQSSYRDPRMKTFLDKYYAWMAGYYDLAMYTQHTDMSMPGKFWGIRSTATETPCPKLDATLAWCAAHNSEPDPDPTPTPPTGDPGMLITDGGFETVKVGPGQWKYTPSGSSWTFVGSAGIAASGGGFTSGSPKAPDGSQVAFLQGNGSMSTTLAVADGSYQVRFEAAQRATFQAKQQDLEVLVNDVSVGKFTPSGKNFQSFTTATFKGSSHKVVFRGLNTAGGDNTALVDKVSLVTVAIAPPPPPDPTPTPTPTPPDPTPTPTDPTPTPTPTPPAPTSTPTPPDPTPTPTPPAPTPTPTPPAPDLAAGSAAVSTMAAALGDTLAALGTQVDALKAAAAKLAADAAKLAADAAKKP
jgi:hypothetical protein